MAEDETIGVMFARMEGKLDRLADNLSAATRELQSEIISRDKQNTIVTEYQGAQIKRHETELNDLRSELEQMDETNRRRVEQARSSLAAEMEKRDTRIDVNRKWLVGTIIAILTVLIALASVLIYMPKR